MDANQFLTQRRNDAERNFERLWSLSKKPLRLRDSAFSALKQKTIRALFYTFYMFYTAKSNPRFRVFSVFRGSQSNPKQETGNCPIRPWPSGCQWHFHF